MRMATGRAARALAVCILAAWTMSVLRAADDKDVVKDIKSRLDATVVGVNDFTVRQEWKMTIADREITTTVVCRYKGIKYRVEMEAVAKEMSLKSTIIFDGKDKWVLTPGRKQKQPADPESASGPFWWRAIPNDARVSGTEKLGDRECHVIKFRQGEADQTMWVDKENSRLLKTERTPAGFKGTISYSDYKRIHGDWEYAQKSESTIPSQGISSGARVTTEVKSIEVNTGAADDLFDPNAAK